VVVLLTGDDLILPADRDAEEHSSDKKLKIDSQPRANVLFEAGMAFGDQRLAKKTILLEFDFDKLRLGSNISDQQRLRLNNSINRREDFIRRLRTAGCAVNLQNKRWHSTGNFYFAYKG
jgi:predicted nucleotide-binding protein